MIMVTETPEKNGKFVGGSNTVNFPIIHYARRIARVIVS
jgi:hypothetical protein